MFKDATLINLEVSTSDHSPILLERFKDKEVFRERDFRFENAWLREPMCQELVKDVWNNNEGRTFFEKLHECLEILSI